MPDLAAGSLARGEHASPGRPSWPPSARAADRAALPGLSRLTSRSRCRRHLRRGRLVRRGTRRGRRGAQARPARRCVAVTPPARRERSARLGARRGAGRCLSGCGRRLGSRRSPSDEPRDLPGRDACGDHGGDQLQRRARPGGQPRPVHLLDQAGRGSTWPPRAGVGARFARTAFGGPRRPRARASRRRRRRTGPPGRVVLTRVELPAPCDQLGERVLQVLAGEERLLPARAPLERPRAEGLDVVDATERPHPPQLPPHGRTSRPPPGSVGWGPGSSR